MATLRVFVLKSKALEEVQEIPLPDKDSEHLRQNDVKVIVADPRKMFESPTLCLLCGSTMSGGKTVVMSHCLRHYTDSSENAVFCDVCNGPAGTGDKPVKMHYAGKEHRSNQEKQKSRICQLHLCKADGHRCGSMSFQELQEQAGVSVPDAQELVSMAPTEVMKTQQAGNAGNVDARNRSKVVVRVLVTLSQTGRLAGGNVVGKPTCTSCLMALGLDPKTFCHRGVELNKTHEDCHVCQRSQELFKVRFDVTQCYIPQMDYSLYKSAFPREETPLEESVSMDTFMKLPDQDKLCYLPGMVDGQVVMLLKPEFKRRASTQQQEEGEDSASSSEEAGNSGAEKESTEEKPTTEEPVPQTPVATAQPEASVKRQQISVRCQKTGCGKAKAIGKDFCKTHCA